MTLCPVAELVDSDDDHDLNFTDGSVSEISQRGVQGRRLTFYLDRDGDSTFYDCQAGGLCHSGHCVGCIESSDCEAGQDGGEALLVIALERCVPVTPIVRTSLA